MSNRTVDFDVTSYDDVREAAEYIGLNPKDPASWHMDDEDIIKKANRKLRRNSRLYKAAVYNIVDGKNIGGMLLVQDFNTLNSAVKEAETHRIGEMSIIEVREYDISNGATIAWNNPKLDTGTVVYRDVKSIQDAIEKAFQKALDDDYFEGTMSYLIDCIILQSFEEWYYLYDAVKLLTDDEVNELLARHGDLEYMKCVDGMIVQADDEIG